MLSGPRPFIPAINVVRVELRLTQDLQHIENVFNFHSNLKPDPTVVQGIADFVESWWSDTLKAYQSSQIAMNEVRATDQTEQNSFFAVANQFQGVTGGYEQPVLPANVSLAVHWGTGRLGRSYQGRTFHVGMPKDQTNNSTVSPIWAANLQTAYSTLLQGSQLNGYPLSVVSYSANGAWRTSALVTPITSVSIETTTDSQRRRLPGRGA